jgi:SAM-dependent methyltransferase
MKTRLRRLAGALKRTREGDGCPQHRRMLSDRPRPYDDCVRAAKQYVVNAQAQEWVNVKPYDREAGRPQYFTEMYDVLNILQVMDLPVGARVLEVGSGPGWVTEILVMLGCEVDAVEPCEDMISTARHRVKACREHYRLDQPPRVRFHCGTLEECELPADTFDGVLFHESLHHVIDERRGLAQVYRALAPGGIMGVSGEPEWTPGNRNLEEHMAEETRRFGTLENPFSRKYLRHLLRKTGFADVVRYQACNGLVPARLGRSLPRKVRDTQNADRLYMTARKPVPGGGTLTTATPSVDTRAEISLLDVRYEPASREASLRVELVNRGRSMWLHSPERTAGGLVSLCLRQGTPTDGSFREASPRCLLPGPVRPGQAVVVEPRFNLPEDYGREPWLLDLLSEQHFLFSSRGTTPVTLTWADGRSVEGRRVG